MCRRWAMALGCVILSGPLTPTPAAAYRNDISLRGLGRPQAQDLKDPAVRRYRRLASELTAALAPRVLQPAETLGMSGFEFSVVSTVAGISGESAYWQGQPGNPVLEGGMQADRKVPLSLWVPSIHLRKGLPLSTEVGASATYLSFSEMFMLGGEVKLAIHESFFRWVPALSVRGAIARLMGSSDLDIITGEFDVLASLPIGIGGMLQVTPFLGYAHIMAQFNSQVIDETPHIVNVETGGDQYGGDDGSLYNFPTIDWGDNQFPRFFGGFRFNVAMLEFAV